MSGGKSPTRVFDAERDPQATWVGVGMVPGQRWADYDINDAQDILLHQLRSALKGLAGISLHNEGVVNDPIHRLYANGENPPDSAVYRIVFIDATHVKWNKNGGTWDDDGGAGYVVTCDGSTINYDVGASGMDIVFNSGCAADDEALVVLVWGGIFTGCRLVNTAGYEVTIEPGTLFVEGYALANLADLIAGVGSSPVTQYGYLRIWLSEIEYTAVAEIGHYRYGGEPIVPSPNRVQVNFSCAFASDIPAAASGEYHVPICKSVDSGGGTLTLTTYIQQVHQSHQNIAALELLTEVLVGKIHTQNSDTGTDSEDFVIDSGDEARNAVKEDATDPPVPDADEIDLTTGYEQDEVEDDIQQVILYDKSTAWIKVEWDAVTDGETGIGHYDVRLRMIRYVGGDLMPDDTQDTIQSVPGDLTDYTFRGLTPGQRYQVDVRAVDHQFNRSDWSGSPAVAQGNFIIAGISGTSEPAASGEIAVTAKASGLLVTWTPIAGVKYYELAIKESGMPNFETDKHGYTTKTEMFIQVAGDADGTHWVAVRGVDGAGRFGEAVYADGTPT